MKKGSKKIKKSKKAQVAPEYITILGIVLVVAIPLIFYTYNTANADIRLNQAQTVADQIASLANSLSKGVPGTSKCIDIFMPEGVMAAGTMREGILLKVDAKNKVNTIFSATHAYHYGRLPVNPGRHTFCVSNGLVFDDPLNPGNLITIKNGGSIHVAGATPNAGDGCVAITQVFNQNPDPDCDDITDARAGYDYNPGSGASGDADKYGFWYAPIGDFNSVDLTICGDGIDDTDCESGVVCPAGQYCDKKLCICRGLGGVCGNSDVETGEECDPPGSACLEGTVCQSNCQCPTCGNLEVDPGEACDPPGAFCKTDDGDAGTCNADCTACSLPACVDLPPQSQPVGDEVYVAYDCCEDDSDCNPGEVCDTSTPNACDRAQSGCGVCDVGSLSCKDYFYSLETMEDCCEFDIDCDEAAGEKCDKSPGNNCESAPPGGCGICVMDADDDNYFPPNDCDDGDASVNPGAPEDCGDGKDNDCDGFIDGDDADCGGGGGSSSTGGFDGCNAKNTGADNDDSPAGIDPNSIDNVEIEMDSYAGGDGDMAISLGTSNDAGIITFSDPIDVTDPATTSLYFDVRAIFTLSQDQVKMRLVEGTSTLSPATLSVRNLAGGTIGTSYQTLSTTIDVFGYSGPTTVTGVYLQFTGNDPQQGNLVLFDNICDP